MRVSKIGSIAILILILVTGSIATATESKVRVYPGQYVVKGTSLAAAGIVGQDSAAILQGAGVEVVRELGGDSTLVRDGFAANVLASDIDSDGTVAYDSDDDFCPSLIKQGLASYCSPNFKISIDATPNDAKYSSLWGMTADEGINAPSAWDLSTGSSNLVVAVIDTGVDYNHSDLKDNMWVNAGEIAGNGIDDDNNGYIDDVHGINALGSGAAAGNPLDDNGHGSHCAGTIGGRGNNGIGVAGVAWRIKIMALKFLSASGSGSLSGAIETINYMVMMKNRGVNVRIANNSWGGGGFSQSLLTAIEAANDAGIIFVAAAGNSANNNDANDSYPASYEVNNVVSVAAIDSDQNLASFSNYGSTSVDIGAPGVGIYSTFKNNGYATLSGTSMATPHVSGVLALLLSHQPALSNSAAIQRIYESGVTRSTLQGLVRTGRSVNVARALRNQTNPVPEPTPPPAPCDYAITEIGYAPDYSADDGTVVNQTDEYGFAAVNLPFEFPFHHDLVSKVTVSPNGVLYTKAAPSSMDYKNGTVAPLNSIAALHTDLKGNAAPYGVRYAASADKAVFYWRSQAYAYESQGDVHVRSVLHANGVIDVFVDFSTDSLQGFLKAKSTIGLSWGEEGSATTYAYNSDLIKRGTAVRFTPTCADAGDSGLSLSGLRAKGVKNNGKVRRKVRPNGTARVQGFGSGTGSKGVTVSLDGIQCSGTVSMRVQDGYGELYTKVPKAARGYRWIQFKSGDVTASVKIKRKKKQKVYGQRFRNVNSPRFKKSCEKLLASSYSN